MIVVDTAIISYFFLAGVRSAQAERALFKDLVWTAPMLWRSEFRFVALAQDLGVPLVTAYKQILRQFPAVAVSLDDFVAG